MIEKAISINICGDFYSDTKSLNENYFTKEIRELFQRSDFNIVNLECPVAADMSKKIHKTGPHLSGSPYTFSYLRQLNTSLVTLATNHLMDFGPEGLLHTMKLCKDNSISYVGAGLSLDQARKPFIFESGDTIISVLNFAENEWSVASENKPGANPVNIIDNVRQIKSAREISDFVLVIIHGGHEQYHLPNPRMVTQYRFYAENGASVVIGHHPHCISGYEVYNDVPIFYSLGNFLFTWKSLRDSWYVGLVLNLTIKRDTKIEWNLIPVKQARNTFTMTLIDGVEKKDVMSEIEKYSMIISDDKLLSDNWECFVEKWYNEKIDMCSPVHLFGNKRIINGLRKTGLNRLFRRKNNYANILNNIRCESHYDLLKRIIEKYLESD